MNYRDIDATHAESPIDHVYEFFTVVNPPSERRSEYCCPVERVRIYPRGYPMSWNVVASSPQYTVLGRPFCFRGSNGQGHLSASSSSTCTSNDDGVCPLIRPDGYKGLVMILPTKHFSCLPDRATRAGLFVFRERRKAPARQILPIMTSKVKSECILRNLARPKPFVSTAFEGVGACFSRIACFYILSPERGAGLSISRTR